MLKDLSQIQKIFSQAKKLESEMHKLEEEIAKKTIEVSSGGEVVKIIINGKQEILDLKIDNTILEGDVKILQDLIMRTLNEAIKQSKEMMKEELKKHSTPFGFGEMTKILQKDD
jgi:DNA-binding YbaB/EbfC family protein